MRERADDSSKRGLLIAAAACAMLVAGVWGCSSAGGSGGAGGSSAGVGGGTAGSGGGATGSGGATGGNGSGGGVSDGSTSDQGDSNSVTDGPAGTPTITMLTPSSAHIGDPSFTLVVDGHDFPPNPLVSFGGNVFSTTVVSATRLQASIPAAALGATPREISVMVTRISGGSMNTNSLPFQILPAGG